LKRAEPVIETISVPLRLIKNLNT